MHHPFPTPFPIQPPLHPPKLLPPHSDLSFVLNPPLPSLSPKQFQYPRTPLSPSQQTRTTSTTRLQTSHSYYTKMTQKRPTAFIPAVPASCHPSCSCATAPATNPIHHNRLPHAAHESGPHRIQTMVPASTAHGFGAVEELELFLHLSERQQPVRMPRIPSVNRIDGRGGAASKSFLSPALPVPKVPDCYVLPPDADIIVMHPGV